MTVELALIFSLFVGVALSLIVIFCVKCEERNLSNKFASGSLKYGTKRDSRTYKYWDKYLSKLEAKGRVSANNILYKRVHIMRDYKKIIKEQYIELLDRFDKVVY